MIDRIQITNYQNHELLRLVLDPHITAIVGESDSGKSAVVRAIRWLTFNRPTGTGFIRIGSDRTSVKIRVDGRVIERVRSKDENTYTIDGKLLEAFGTDVPEEITRLLAVGPENFQGQHDPPFWFCLTGGEVAKQLNKVVDLELIDVSMAKITSEIRSLTTVVKHTKERVEQVKQEKLRLRFVPAMASHFDRMEQVQKRAEEGREKQGILRSLMDVLGSTQERYRLKSNRSKALDKLVTRGVRLVAGATRLGSLKSLLSATQNTQMELKQKSNRSKGLGKLIAAGSKLVEGTERQRDLKRLLGRVQKIQQEVDELGAKSDRIRIILRKDTGGQCPICGGPLEE